MPIDVAPAAELVADHSQSEAVAPTVGESELPTENEILSAVGDADEPDSLNEQIALTDTEFEAMDSTMTLRQSLNVIWLVGAVTAAAMMLWIRKK